MCPFCSKKLELRRTFININYYEDCDCDEYIEKNKKAREDYSSIRDLESKIDSYASGICSRENEPIRLLEESNLGRRFKSRTFDTFQQDKNPTAYQKAFDYAEGFESNKGEGLLFSGTPGTGKTHLAAAITNHIIFQFSIAVKFGSFIDILEDIKKTFGKKYDKKADDDDLLEQLIEIPLLVIDDIGKENSTDWSNSILYRVINRRYEDYKPIIITTNYSIKELEQNIGKATFSRIIEMCDGIKMDGNDFRKQKLLGGNA